MKQYLIGLVLGLASLMPFARGEEIAPKPTLDATPYLIRPATTTTIPAIIDSCDDVRALALSLGFERKTMPTVIRIIHRESRCQPEAINKTLNADGSWDYGLAQINDRSWCRPSRWYPDGYLQKQGILETCEDLLDPKVNLLAMAELMRYSVGSTGCAFSPWRIDC